jgi:uncharacterized protein YndB with AHSA1/START domain
MQNNSAAAGDKLVISWIFNAPCALVYRAWTDPKQMVQWWSPKEIECRSVQADLKIGGAYRIHMISDEGDHIAIGQYQQIIPNRLLQFTWQWEHYAMPESTVTVEFEDLGKTTRLTLTHDGLPDAEDVPDHESGWTSALEKFGEMIEQGKIKAD